MSSYTAIIHCKKCGKELAKVHAYHDRPDFFVPQDILQEDFGIDSKFCQDCLNGRSENDNH